jgi:hypothetical protein
VTSVIRDVWPENTPLENPIKKRRINLAYEGVDKVLLSFKFTSTNDSFLQPSNPIVINNQSIVINDLPQHPSLLTFVEKSDIDVSNLIKISSQGEYNIVQVNIIEKRRWWFRPRIGTLHLYFKIFLQEKKIELPEQDTKFCMNCGRNIQKNMVYCSFCGLAAPFGGTSYKECRNCNSSTLLPPTAAYCKLCGSKQPDI